MKLESITIQHLFTTLTNITIPTSKEHFTILTIYHVLPGTNMTRYQVSVKSFLTSQLPPMCPKMPGESI